MIQGPNKIDVGPWSIVFYTPSDRRIRIRVTAAESKASEVQPMIEEVYTAILRHYNRGNKMAPRDVASALRDVADAVEKYSLVLTEDKYNARAQKPRVQKDQSTTGNDSNDL